MRTVAFMLALLAVACEKPDAPGTTRVTSGEAKRGVETAQPPAPVRAFDHYLDGFHVMKDDPSLRMEAHHFCKSLSEELTQCAIFDGNDARANLIGIEYMISDSLYRSLDEEERPSWHPHNYEILSGQLVMPSVPGAAEKGMMAKMMNSYGKTWHIWDTGHHGHIGQKLPVGHPKLAWSANRDGEIPQALLDDRDRRMNISTEERRRERSDLTTIAKPQSGVDDLKAMIPGAIDPPPEGVRDAFVP
jgi:hypothetical protein